MNVFRAMPAMTNIHLDRSPRHIISTRPNLSLGWAASTSQRAGHLVMCAMTYFDSNREVAWVCLRDASTLLGVEYEESSADTPWRQSASRPGGLAVWRAKRAIQLIENHLGSKLRIREIADSVGLSKSHFSRAFKQSLGDSPSAYLNMRRIEHAKILMTSTRERLAAIALLCGFADQPHFNRCFRRLVGVSPGRWRCL
jgi:AraC-like DNA-binding protein